MSDRSLYQILVGEVADFFTFVGEALTGEVERSALISDLGGDPSASTGTAAFPADKLATLKSYATAPAPDTEADLAALGDVLVVLDAIASNIEVWSFDIDQAEQLGHSLLDLLGTTYVRLRWPRLYLWLELASILEEASSSFGAGSNNLLRLGTASWATLKFLFDPGKTIADLDPDDPEDSTTDIVVDGLFRLGAATVAVLDSVFDIAIVGDVLAGWDAPGLDESSSVPVRIPPTSADLISGRMISISLAHDSDNPASENATAGRAQISFAYVPKNAGGRKVFLGFGGAASLDAPINDRWRFAVRLRSDAAVATMIGADELSFAASSGSFEAGVGWTSRPDPATGLSFALPRPVGTRLEIGHLAFTLRLGTTAAEMRAELADAALVIDSSDSDGLIRRLLGGTPLRLPFSVVLGYASDRGLIVEGGIPKGSPSAGGTDNAPLAGDGPVGRTVLAATVPISRQLGAVTIHEVAVRLARDSSGASAEEDILAVETVVTLSAQIGPVYFRVDQLGLACKIDNSVPRSERNLRFLDARLGIAFPLAITVNVDTDIVSGGGTLFHDPRTGTYFGVFAVRLWQRVTLKAIALISTRDPDGTEASSFIVIATVEGLGWQIGPVTVDGLGVLYASDRTFDEAAVRAALPTGQLKHLLFPADPVRHAPEILAPLASFFPALRDSYLVGVLVRLIFGRPPKVTLDLALIFQGGRAVSNRLIVLGRISSILPDDRIRAVQLNLEAVGVFDPSEGTASMDAVLVDSKLCGRFPLTGSAALRRVHGPVGFALAVGGFHPQFTVPAGFPALQRITVALTAGDNPKLICSAYLAITSNTVQFGAEASLYAAACGFSISGSVGFDVLIQLFPPHFLAQFRAKVQLKRGSRNLFSVSVTAEVEGPLPLRVSGKATFEILWCDFSVSFDKTLVGGDGPLSLPAVDVSASLRESLNDPNSWQAEPPPAGQRMVSVRRDDRAGEVLLHPMGTLSVRQGVVPLNLGRDIDRVGGAVPSGDRRFAVTGASIGPVEQDLDPVRDLFAPGQFFDLTDDESLAAPSFEEMEAGVSFGVDGYAFAAAARVDAPFDYTEITIGPDGEPVLEEEPQPLEGGLVLILAAFGAAALAPIRLEAASRFGPGQPRTDAPVVRPHGWALAEVSSTAASGPALTWAEAHPRLTRTQVLVPAVVAR